MYNKPESEVIELNEEDVILTSLIDSEEVPVFPGEVEFG